jgi:hypothetical protein
MADAVCETIPTNTIITTTCPRGVQAHGKIWEEQIVALVVSPENVDEALHQPYTAVYDIPQRLNTQLKECRNISIKSTKNKRVDFADAVRTVHNIESAAPLEAVVIRYKQCGDTKVPTKIIRISLNHTEIYLGRNFELVRQDIYKLSQILKSGASPNEYGELAKEVKNNMRANESYLTIAPKKGNAIKKRAGRLQISLSNIEKLVAEHPELVIENDILDHTKLTTLKSEKRQFRKAIADSTSESESPCASSTVLESESESPSSASSTVLESESESPCASSTVLESEHITIKNNI